MSDGANWKPFPNKTKKPTAQKVRIDCISDRKRKIACLTGKKLRDVGKKKAREAIRHLDFECKKDQRVDSINFECAKEKKWDTINKTQLPAWFFVLSTKLGR